MPGWVTGNPSQMWISSRTPRSKVLMRTRLRTWTFGFIAISMQKAAKRKRLCRPCPSTKWEVFIKSLKFNRFAAAPVASVSNWSTIATISNNMSLCFAKSRRASCVRSRAPVNPSSTWPSYVAPKVDARAHRRPVLRVRAQSPRSAQQVPGRKQLPQASPRSSVPWHVGRGFPRCCDEHSCYTSRSARNTPGVCTCSISVKNEPIGSAFG
mmetsp:Transcript_58668/g.128397  ORF Transcript_58668/g.128397 Transcript_58668/m.128397 type:complete len:210 (-) Transcript_58668:1262-1891(-)